jgi:hypothetical protein
MGNAKDYASENPAFTRAGLAGVEANHSSTVRSTENDLGSHAQSDDELQDIPPPEDPNLSGLTPTTALYTWEAGPMQGWKENDDYRTYFERNDWPDSQIGGFPYARKSAYRDGDYDDNGGIPTGIGQDTGQIGHTQETIEGVRETSEKSSGSFEIGPTIKRRI